MSDAKLSKEEEQILKDFEAGEFKSILTSKRKEILQATAEATFKKSKSMVNQWGQTRLISSSQ